MKIAIIGAGISGLTAAYLLHKQHQVSVFESADRIGGHTATIDVDYHDEQHKIDTGFIVFNDRTYPNFMRLLSELNVDYQKSSMGFSVFDPVTGLEYAGNNLDTLFAQRKNLFSFKFLRMVKDILRFNKQGTQELASVDDHLSLEAYLIKHQYSREFCEYYLIPMASAIWSASSDQILQFPILFFLSFFHNHGLLSVKNRPQWYVIAGGSSAYLKPLTAGFKDKIMLNSDIVRVVRNTDQVVLHFADGQEQYFDHVIFATHSDQALALLADPSVQEREILGAIPYQENSVVLHTDTRLLPNTKKTWSSWNYQLQFDSSRLPILTYNMNILQGLQSAHTYCVTLNADEYIQRDKIIGRYRYAHPQFSIDTKKAQCRKQEICGVNATSYCGAYWANGFHEDGVSSAMDAVSRINAGAV